MTEICKSLYLKVYLSKRHVRKNSECSKLWLKAALSVVNRKFKSKSKVVIQMHNA